MLPEVNSWGLRHLVLVAPILASIVHAAAGPVAALGVVAVLVSFDRFGKAYKVTALC